MLHKHIETRAYQSHVSKTPLDILKERFARGEIDKEEFGERRRLLKDEWHRVSADE